MYYVKKNEYFGEAGTFDFEKKTQYMVVDKVDDNAVITLPTLEMSMAVCSLLNNDAWIPLDDIDCSDYTTTEQEFIKIMKTCAKELDFEVMVK